MDCPAFQNCFFFLSIFLDLFLFIKSLTKLDRKHLNQQVLNSGTALELPIQFDWFLLCKILAFWFDSINAESTQQI